MEDDVFCKIIKGELTADFIYQDDDLLVIRDIKPKTRIHLLIIPKKHLVSINEAMEEDKILLGKMILMAGQMAERQGVDKSGYKLQFNVGEGGGQIVPHLHLHLLAD